MNHQVYDDYVNTEPAVFADLRALFSVERVAVVFDVGACEGEDSLRYARLFKRARVFAFEPLPANQELIRAHFQRHGADRCELAPLALAEKNGSAVFHVSSGAPDTKPLGEDWNYGNKSSSLLPPKDGGPSWVPWLEFNQQETVSTCTLDTFCERQAIAAVDFVHIDVQGAEWLVLQGAVTMLPRIRCLWIEVADAEVYQGQRVRAEIDAFLADRGFRPVRRVCNGVESDVLYVNVRWAPGRRLWLARRAHAALLRASSRVRDGLHGLRRLLRRR